MLLGPPEAPVRQAAPLPVSSEVPAPLAGLVGRGSALEQLQRQPLEPGARLLTLVGPAGVGKSRLAVALCEPLRTAFADGVLYLSLAPLATPQQVQAALAQALHIHEPNPAAQVDRIRLRIIDASTGQAQDKSNPIVASAEPPGVDPRAPTGGVSWTLTAVRPGAVQVQVSISGDFYWSYCGCVTTVWGSGAASEWLAVGGAPTPTSTPTQTPTTTPSNTPTNTPFPLAALKAQYKVNDGSATDNQIKPGLRVLNTGTASVALSDITLRYWYTRDGSQGQVYTCDYAAVGCANVVGTISAFANPASTADRYLEIGFKSAAGSLAPGMSSGEIQSRLNKTDWSSYNEANDYSYGASQTSFADWSTVTVYYKGALVWGTEPSSGPTPTNTPEQREQQRADAAAVHPDPGSEFMSNGDYAQAGFKSECL